MKPGQPVRYTGPNESRQGKTGRVVQSSNVYPSRAWVDFDGEPKTQLVERQHLQLIPEIEKEVSHG